MSEKLEFQFGAPEMSRGRLQTHVVVTRGKTALMLPVRIHLDDEAEVDAFVAKVRAIAGDETPPDLKQRVLDLCVPPEPEERLTLEKYQDQGDPKPWNGKPRQTWNAAEGDLAVATGNAYTALQVSNTPPTLFVHGDDLVWVTRNPVTHEAVPQPLTLSGLRNQVARRTRPVVETKSGYRVIGPPRLIIENMLEEVNDNLPALQRVVAVPVFTASGALLYKAGYDYQSGLFYDPSPNTFIPVVPLQPDGADVRRALRIIAEVLYDFPFVKRSDRAHAIALLIEQFARDLIPGPLPIHVMEAPQRSTGKTLITEVLCYPFLGAWVERHNLPGDEEERRKTMLSFLRLAKPYLLLDNVSIRMESDALDAVLTTSSYTGRILGVSREVTVPVRCSFIATSNNPDIELQLARRSVHTRMDAKREDQEFRSLSEYRHPDLKGWVAAHRGELVWAALVLVRAYLEAGRPAYTGTVLGSFEAWSRVVGGILQNAGIKGFMEDAVTIYHASDSESQAWQLFVEKWWDKYGPKDLTVSELYAIALEVEEFSFGTATGQQGQRTSLGKALRKKVNNVIGGLFIREGGRGQHHQHSHLEPVDPRNPPPRDDEGTSGRLPETMSPSQDGSGTPESRSETADRGTWGTSNPGAFAVLQNKTETPVDGRQGTSAAPSGGPEAADLPCKTVNRSGLEVPQVPLPGFFERAGRGTSDDGGGDSAPGSPPSPPPGTVEGLRVQMVTTEEGLQEALRAIMASSVVGCDIETYAEPGQVDATVAEAVMQRAQERTPTGRAKKPYTAAELETMRANVRKNLALDTHQGQVRLVQIAAPGDAVYLFDARCVDIRGLAPVFTAPERPVAIFQNGAFDLQLLWQHGIQVPDGSRLWDTMLAAQVAEANADKANEHYGLGDLVQRYLGREIDKEPQGSDWSGPLSSDQLHYAALDAAILLPLYRAQVEQLRADNQLPVVTDIEAPCLPATAWLEWAGLAVDEPGWVDVEAYAREQRDRVKAELDAYVAERLDVEKWHARLRAEGYQNAEILASDTVNWVAPQQTKAALWVMGHPVESTEEDDLAALSDPLLGGHIIAYRKARRRAEAYGRKYLVNMNPVTRRLHPSFLQCRASTGRFSCADPNTQQVPKDPRYRSKFRASAGHCLLDADYNQIELRIIAEITGDTYMLDLFQKGVDLHRLIVHEVFGIPLDQITEEERRKGKAINFGFAYGQYEKGFIARAKAEYGVTFTWEEAHRAREVFLSTYPMIKAWHERYQQPYGAPKVYVDTYTVCGRRRQRVWRFNEKLASPVQGSAADGIKRAMALLYERRHEAPDAVLVNMIHDELLVECDIATHQRAAQWLKQAMVDGMKEVLHILEPVVEIKAYLDWGVTPLANE